MFTPGSEVVEVEAEEGGLFYVSNTAGGGWTVWLDRTSSGNNPTPKTTHATKAEAIASARSFKPLPEQYGPYTGAAAREYLLRTRKPGAVAGAGGPATATFANPPA